MVLETLIGQYVELYDSRIHMIIQLFTDKFGEGHHLGMFWNGLIDKTGYLDADHQIEYSFHGGGVSVYFADEEVISFDFDGNNGYSFDDFKFCLFIESTNALKEYKSIIKDIYSLKVHVKKHNGHFVLTRIISGH